MTLGFDPDSFWDQTIRTITAAMRGKNEAQRIEHNRQAWIAWHIAAFHRAKKMPSLKSLMAKKRPREQTWQEQAAIMQSWANARNKRLGIDG